MSFANRREAGRRLVSPLLKYRDANPVVLALPRGGVPVAAAVAEALEAPLDLLLVRKIGAPLQPELAMGAVIDGHSPTVIRNEDVIEALGIPERDFQAACRKELMEIERRRTRYLGKRTPIEIGNRTAIIIDDGIATGATVRAALHSARSRRPRQLVLAVPVGASDTLARLRPEANDIVCLESHDHFGAIGEYFNDFTQVSDEDVVALLDAARARTDKLQKSGAGR
jgi:predicted phosphoribosyltransferase